MRKFEGNNCPEMKDRFRELQAAADEARNDWRNAETKFTLDLLASVGVVPPCRVIVKCEGQRDREAFLLRVYAGTPILKKVKKDGTASQINLYFWGVEEILPHGAGEKRESQDG